MPFAAALAACGDGSGDLDAAERLALEAQLDSIEALFRPGALMDAVLQRYVGFFQSDAVLRPPDGDPVTGRAAALEYYGAGFEGLEPISLDYGSPEILLDGDLAIRRYDGVARAVVTETSDTLEFRTRYVDVLEKTIQGGWSIAVHTWSPLDQ